MKKFKSLLITLLVFIVCIPLFTSCQDTSNGSKKEPNAHICDFDSNIVYKERNKQFYVGYPCKLCDEINTVKDVLSVNHVIKTTDYNPNQILSNVKSGDVVVFKSGRHTSNLSLPLDSVKILGETGTILYGLNTGNLTNVTIENIEFESSTTLNSNINGLTYKNCKFSYGVFSESPVKDVTFDACAFKDLTSPKETAIRLTDYENLTVKNCIFENIAYNALQVGLNCSGSLLISGNTFKDIKSRVLYLINVKDLSSCSITDNVFYDHHSNYIADESYDETGCKKDSGIYIHTKSQSGVLNVGVNTWENIPLHDISYIAPLAEYDPTQQISMF
ncbi:MAG: hypothetical protein IJ506_05965 [Clostridia bacterium]|nr:hypothetical protein [Clostridia bacterium]